MHTAKAIPIVIPAMGDEQVINLILDRVDGVLISGARSNVHPQRYGAEENEKYEPYDLARDETSLILIRLAIKRGIPLLAICRGIQELNVALGGTLQTEIQELEGVMDHRFKPSDNPDVRFEIRQKIKINSGGILASIFESDLVKVNTLHRQAIKDLATELNVEAMAEDGIIEAVSLSDSPGFVLGVQWHPEYWSQDDIPSQKIFTAFGDFVQTYALSQGR